MRTVIFYAHVFSWSAVVTQKEDDNDYQGDTMKNTLVSFVHIEPEDNDPEKKVVTRFLKQIKQIARKWETKNIVLYSFSHLGEAKAEINISRSMIRKIAKRLREVGYEVKSTPFKCFVNFNMDSPGAPLSRVYRVF